MPPADAVSVALCAVVTAETVAVNPALPAPPGTVTDLGTLTALLLLVRLTVSPPLAAGAVRATVHATLPEPVIEFWLQDSAFRVAVVVELVDEPFPCSLTLSDGLDLEVLETVSCPVESPLVFGVNCTPTLYVPFAATEIGRLVVSATLN